MLNTIFSILSSFLMILDFMVDILSSWKIEQIRRFLKTKRIIKTCSDTAAESSVR